MRSTKSCVVLQNCIVKYSGFLLTRVAILQPYTAFSTLDLSEVIVELDIFLTFKTRLTIRLLLNVHNSQF